MGWQDVHEPRWATFSVWSRAEGAQVLRTPRVCVELKINRLLQCVWGAGTKTIKKHYRIWARAPDRRWSRSMLYRASGTFRSGPPLVCIGVYV